MDINALMADPKMQYGLNLLANTGRGKKKPSLASQMALAAQQMHEWNRQQDIEKRRREYMEMIEKAMQEKALGTAGARVPYSSSAFGLNEDPSYLNNFLTPW
jgi:hypothetical protein